MSRQDGTAALRVISAFHATLQDGGRPGYRAFGVPSGGAADRESLALANILVGNRPDAAALELALAGGTFAAEGELALALAGAPFSARIERRDGPDRPLTIPQSFTLRTGERLRIGGASVGARAYLAVSDGWQSEEILGSRSGEDRLPEATTLRTGSARVAARRPADWGFPDPEAGPIRYLPALDTPILDAAACYIVGARSNRMGLRLEGPPIEIRAAAERLSEPVVPGTIQVAGGRPIVLGPACGTMGGYPVAGWVVSADLDRLGQARPGASLAFRPVGLDEARRLDQGHRRELAGWFLRLACGVGDSLG